MQKKRYEFSFLVTCSFKLESPKLMTRAFYFYFEHVKITVSLHSYQQWRTFPNATAMNGLGKKNK